MAAPMKDSSASDHGISEACTPADSKQTETATVARRPWLRDPHGVSYLGADGVLRSLNADRTEVLDYRRLSPEEVMELASPWDQAIQDRYVGVDGRDVTDEAVLWAVPENAKTVPEEALGKTPLRREVKN